MTQARPLLLPDPAPLAGTSGSVPRWHAPSLIAFSLAIAILITAGVISYISINRTADSGRSLAGTTSYVGQFDVLAGDLTVVQLRQRLYVATKAQPFLDAYPASVAAVTTDLTDLAALTTGDSARAQTVAAITKQTDAFMILLATGLPAAEANPAVTPATGAEVRAAGDALRATIRTTQTDERATLQDQTDSAGSSARRTVRATSFLSAAAVLVLIAAYGFIHLQIRRRRRAEVQLAQMLAEARDLYDHAPCGYFTTDVAGLVVEANRTALAWLGYERAEFMGTLFAERLGPDSFERLREAAVDLVNEGSIRELELDVRRKDGSELPVLLNASLVLDNAGAPQMRVTIFDISERRHTDASIRQLNRDLSHRAVEIEASNKELEAFCYSVSHDLRAPLRTINGYSEALLEDYEPMLDGDGQRMLGRVRLATQRMGQLIDDLLALSRVTRGDFAREEADLSAIVESVGVELRSANPGREVALLVAPGVVADGDPRLIRIVLENLLSNSWKYTSKHDRAAIEFGVEHQDGRTVYFVRDDGAGFEMQYASKLFGVFQRLHNIEEFGGTGIGLATVQRIIQRHGGAVWADASLEGGAKFSFTLAPDVAATADLPAAATTATAAAEAAA